MLVFDKSCILLAIRRPNVSVTTTTATTSSSTLAAQRLARVDAYVEFVSQGTIAYMLGAWEGGQVHRLLP